MADQVSVFRIGDAVIYTGRTYNFPGKVSAIFDDGQIGVTALGDPVTGHYAGMKHIFGPSQLQPLVDNGLSCDQQFDIATRLAADIGYVLVPEPDHLETPVDNFSSVRTPR